MDSPRLASAPPLKCFLFHPFLLVRPGREKRNGRQSNAEISRGAADPHNFRTFSSCLSFRRNLPSLAAVGRHEQDCRRMGTRVQAGPLVFPPSLLSPAAACSGGLETPIGRPRRAFLDPPVHPAKSQKSKVQSPKSKVSCLPAHPAKSQKSKVQGQLPTGPRGTSHWMSFRGRATRRGEVRSTKPEALTRNLGHRSGRPLQEFWSESFKTAGRAHTNDREVRC